MPSITAQLPAGLPSRDGNVTVFARAVDVYLSEANASAVVNVVTNSSVNPATFLKGGITTALSSGNVDAVLGLISAVSSSISSTNCTHAPNCTALNRGPCLESPNTCGACNTGFLGVFGNGNARCHRVVRKHGRRLVAVDLEAATAGPTRSPSKGPSKGPTARPSSAGGTADGTYVIGDVGEKCKQHGNCLYDLCVGGRCLAPNQTCSTNIPGQPCSGNGVCKFFDNSGNPFAGSCSILNVFCSAKCLCQAGFGGADCSLAPSALSAQSSARVTMCAALLKTTVTQDKSAQLFDSITSALLSSYEFSEITSSLGQVRVWRPFSSERSIGIHTHISPPAAPLRQVACSQLLSFLGKMAHAGYLKGTKPTTQQFYAEISSQFVAASSSGGVPPSSQLYEMAVSGGTAATTAAAATIASHVSAAVNGITQGVQKTIVAGQAPTSIVTDNLRATMSNELTSKFANAVMSAPQTEAGAASSAPSPAIRLVGSTLNLCGFGGGYAQIGTSQYGSNPFPASTAVQSPLLKFSTGSETKTAKAAAASRRNRRLQEAAEERLRDGWSVGGQASADGGSSERMLAAKTVVLMPAFYVIMPFNTPQTLNFTAIASRSRKGNFTLPACAIRQGGTYVSCGNCNITSVTSWNVTYGCFDVDRICPGLSKKGKPTSKPVTRLLRGSKGGAGSGNNGDDGATDDLMNVVSNATAILDDMAGDDDGGATDDQFSSKMTVGGNTFGALAEAVASEITSVLSFNPLTIDLSKAMPVLVLVGSFVFVVLTGFIYFLRVDKFERHCFLYMREYEVEKERKKIEDDLRAGGSGIVVEAEAVEEADEEGPKAGRDEEAKKAEVRGFTSQFNAVVGKLRDGVRGRGRYDKYRVHAGATEAPYEPPAPQHQQEQQQKAPAGPTGRAPPSLAALSSHGSSISFRSLSPGPDGGLIRTIARSPSPALPDGPPPDLHIDDTSYEQDHSPKKIHGHLMLPVLISEFSNNVLAGLASKKAEAMALQKEVDGSRRSFLEVRDVLWSIAKVRAGYVIWYGFSAHTHSQRPNPLSVHRRSTISSGPGRSPLSHARALCGTCPPARSASLLCSLTP